MHQVLTYSDSDAFLTALDFQVESKESLEIIFADNVPSPSSKLWQRLGQCSGWSPMVASDYMVSTPELMPPYDELQAVGALVPAAANFFRFSTYRKYRISTQSFPVGKDRKIALDLV